MNLSFLLEGDELPLYTGSPDSHLVSVVGYSILMVVSSIGNITVLFRLVTGRTEMAIRLKTLLIHLAIADLLVTFFLMPIEISWALTDRWLAGDLMCRAMMFAKVFGLYVSSFMVICIAVDRYYAILKPLNVSWEKRLPQVLWGVWGGAALASLPQCILFHVMEHPAVKGYVQCVTQGLLPESWEFTYFMFNMTLLYLLPLAATLYCSIAAIREITKRKNTDHDDMRRSGVGVLEKARARTLRMTVTIVAVFIICWTPYYLCCLWYWIDTEFISKMDPMILKAMWLFSCTNSSFNPIVYGILTRKRQINTAHKPGDVLLFNKKAIDKKDIV